MKTLESLGIADLTVGKIDWTVSDDCDGESVWKTASGRVDVTVKLVERNAEAKAYFDVSKDGDYTYREYDEITACDIDEEHEDVSEVLDEMNKKAQKLDWAEIERHLDRDHSNGISDEAGEAIYEACDREAYNRDPYRYYGLSRSDFR